MNCTSETSWRCNASSQFSLEELLRESHFTKIVKRLTIKSQRLANCITWFADKEERGTPGSWSSVWYKEHIWVQKKKGPFYSDCLLQQGKIHNVYCYFWMSEFNSLGALGSVEWRWIESRVISSSCSSESVRWILMRSKPHL